MSKSIKLNGVTYTGVSKVKLPLASNTSQYAQFRDVDEVSPPTGTRTITENGTYDVTNYASAVVDVPTSGGQTSPLTLVNSSTVTHSEDWSSNKKVADFASLYCNASDTTDNYLYICDINNTFSGNNAAQRAVIFRRVGEATTFSSGPVTNLIWLYIKRTNDVTPHWGGVLNSLTSTTSSNYCDYGSTPASLSFFIGSGSTVTIKKYSINFDWEG